jgi:hypothetical protein
VRFVPRHKKIAALESDNETRLETMSDPWLSIPLADYEGHMGADNVQQLSALSDLFKRLRPLATGKTLWLGIFSSAAIGS